ncbi:GIY-YIG nuclease family protein [Luteolibacter sp. Populi]|uniref:GIY-YIG nuclease family protein n=1 Tax=Luteolibacter sp. Populi TaxID=3230487 RepID=UPI003467974C
MSSPKTLQIFLPQGSPSGIRIAELTTRIVQAVACPRTELEALFKRVEIGHIATYFLFGGSDEDSKPEAYIGQTEDLVARLKVHDAKKEFWHTVVFLISRTHSFTQAHIRWMEWKGIATSSAAKRYNLSNGNAGSEPFVTEAMRADLDEIFETGAILLEALGIRYFVP